MKKTLLSLVTLLAINNSQAQGYTYFSAPNSEKTYYNAIMPADSGLLFGMSKTNNNSSLYWLKNNQLTELKSVSSASSAAATFPDNNGNYKQWFTKGNKALFVVNDPVVYKNTVWVTDGTVAGTDSLFSSGNFNVKFYMGGMIGTDFYFTVTSLSPYRTLLYKTDFTKAGTTLVKTINNTNLFWPYVDNGVLYLHGYIGATASYDVLYKYTSDTTRLLLGYTASQAHVYNGDLYYGKTTSFYKKNLSTNAITTLNNTFNFNTNQLLGMFKNKVYVLGVNSTANTQQNIYVTDGTTGSLALLYNNSNLARIPTTYFNYLFGSNFGYFIGTNANNHYALYATDGSNAGTHQVQDLQGTSSSLLGGMPTMRMCGDKLFFNCLNYAIGSNYYSSYALSTCDTLRNSLSLINWSTSGSASIQNIENFQNKLVFTGDDGSTTYQNKLQAINTCAAYSPLTVGISEQYKQQVAVYPNPSKGMFTIQLPAFENLSARLFNLMGQKVADMNLNAQQNSLQVDLPAGIYNLLIYNGTQLETTKKLIIE